MKKTDIINIDTEYFQEIIQITNFFHSYQSRQEELQIFFQNSYKTNTKYGSLKKIIEEYVIKFHQTFCSNLNSLGIIMNVIIYVVV